MPMDAYVASAALAILTLAIVAVKAVTFGVGAYRKYREPRLVICPEGGGHARVEIQAQFAALMEALGIGRLVIRNCSRWPERRACERKCLRQIKTARDPLARIIHECSKAKTPNVRQIGARAGMSDAGIVDTMSRSEE